MTTGSSCTDAGYIAQSLVLIHTQTILIRPGGAQAAEFPETGARTPMPHLKPGLTPKRQRARRGVTEVGAVVPGGPEPGPLERDADFAQKLIGL